MVIIKAAQAQNTIKLSIGGYEIVRFTLIISNTMVRQQFFDYILCNNNIYLSWTTDDNIIDDLGFTVVMEGAHCHFLHYIASRVHEKCSFSHGECFFMLTTPKLTK